MEKVEKTKEELVEYLEKFAVKAYPNDIHKQSVFIHGAMFMSSRLDKLQTEVLDTAAVRYAQDKYLPVQTSQAFKAGAKWIEQQLKDK